MILSSAIRAWICAEPIDMRKSIDGLAALVRPMLGQDPFVTFRRNPANPISA